MYKRKIAAALFALLATAVIVAGCGGGGDSTGSSSTADTTAESSGSTESSESSSSSGSDDESSDEGSSDSDSSGAAPTKAAFIKEADKVCSKAELALSKEVLSFAKANGIDIEKEEEPSDDQKTEIYETIVLPGIAKQAEELEALTPPAGDESKIEELTSTLTDEVESAEDDPSSLDENTFQDASKMAQEYGLTSCGA